MATRGSVMRAMMRIVSPHRGHRRGSTSKMRRTSSAHRRRSAASSGSSCGSAAGGDGRHSAPSPRAASSRRRLALTTLEYAPQERMRCSRGSRGLPGARAAFGGFASWFSFSASLSFSRPSHPILQPPCRLTAGRGASPHAQNATAFIARRYTKLRARLSHLPSRMRPVRHPGQRLAPCGWGKGGSPRGLRARSSP